MASENGSRGSASRSQVGCAARDLYELKGSAGPGRTVILNGDRVPIVFEKSSFRYFVGPLHHGITILTMPVQNEYGGVNTEQLAVSRGN
jgi:hypothetical protein